MSGSSFRMTLTALLAALVFLLGMTPLGIIPLGFVNVTVLCVPVIIGTILLGLNTGLLLGFAFGTASFLSAIGVSMTPPSALIVPIVSGNVFLAAVLCYVPRLIVPVAAHFTYVCLSRKKSESLKSVSLSAVIGSVTNTVLYLGGMLLIYGVMGLDNAYLLSLISGIALLAGGAEAIVAALLSVPILKALWSQSRKSK